MGKSTFTTNDKYGSGDADQEELAPSMTFTPE
uniref:Uncharacterized protein n=1 Tax=Peronospora matthiolae TaxID=2874970 RepID=A0AAV1U5T6_9STRA